MKTIPATLAAFSVLPPFVTGDTAYSINEEAGSVAILTLPAGHGLEQSPDAPDLSGMDTLAGAAAYRIALDPRQLLAISMALEVQTPLVLEFSADPAAPVRVLNGQEQIGWVMPAAMPPTLTEGLLITPATTGTEKGNPAIPTKESKPLPAPIVHTSAKRNTLEVEFGGVPPEETRKAIGNDGLGFRYSGRGTKRGVPGKMWYATDTPANREALAQLIPGTAFKEAA